MATSNGCSLLLEGRFASAWKLHTASCSLSRKNILCRGSKPTKIIIHLQEWFDSLWHSFLPDSLDTPTPTLQSFGLGHGGGMALKDMDYVEPSCSRRTASHSGQSTAVGS